MCYYWLKLVKLNKYGKVKKKSWRFKHIKRRRFVYKLVRHELVYLKEVRIKSFFRRFRLYWLSKFLLFPFLTTTKFNHYGLGWLKYKIFGNDLYFLNRYNFKKYSKFGPRRVKNSFFLKKKLFTKNVNSRLILSKNKKKKLFFKKHQLLKLINLRAKVFNEKKMALVLKLKKKLFNKYNLNRSFGLRRKISLLRKNKRLNKFFSLRRKRGLLKNKRNLNKFFNLRRKNSLKKNKSNLNKFGNVNNKRKFLKIRSKSKNWNFIFNKQLKRLMPKVLVCARKKKNNFFITATDLAGKLLLLVTIGMSGYKGPAKSTDLAIEKSVDFFCKKLKLKSFQLGFRVFRGGKMIVQGRRKFFKKSVSNIFLFFATRFNKYLRIFVRRLKKNKISWSGAIVNPVVSHNGMRTSKRRRK